MNPISKDDTMKASEIPFTTPLHYACKLRNVGAIKLLIKYGAKFNKSTVLTALQDPAIPEIILDYYDRICNYAHNVPDHP